MLSGESDATGCPAGTYQEILRAVIGLILVAAYASASNSLACMFVAGERLGPCAQVRVSLRWSQHGKARPCSRSTWFGTALAAGRVPYGAACTVHTCSLCHVPTRPQVRL